jgi:hypothetical protein
MTRIWPAFPFRLASSRTARRARVFADTTCQWSGPNVAVMTHTEMLVTSLPRLAAADRWVEDPRIEEGP